MLLYLAQLWPASALELVLCGQDATPYFLNLECGIMQGLVSVSFCAVLLRFGGGGVDAILQM